MGTLHFSHRLTIELRAPLVEVWSVIADYARDADWREGVSMEHTPAGLVRDGTRTREGLRMLGSVHLTDAVVSDVVPYRSFRFVSRDGRVQGARELEARGDLTLLTVSIRVEPPPPMSLFAPLLGLLFRRRVRRDLARLSALVARVPAVVDVAACSAE